MKRLSSIKFPLAALLACLLVVNCSAETFSLKDGTLRHGSRAVLEKVPAEFALVEDPTGAGVFLKWSAEKPESLIRSTLGSIAGLKRFTSCHRNEPFWMVPHAGTREADVNLETQWLLADTGADNYVMLVPLIDGPFVFTFSGGDDGVKINGQTGDPAVTGKGGVALFVSCGTDPYAMADAGAKAVMQKLGTGELRIEKPLPDFVNDFGWCTWDSFYREVSADKVRTGLASFAEGKVEPRLLILDDGWQDWRKQPTGEEKLVSLEPNQAQFAGDLRPTVRVAKEEFKVRTLLAWHAFIGYWSGVDGSALPDYGVRDINRSFGEDILKLQPKFNTHYWGKSVGVVPPENIGRFYDDYHQRLQAQGVDGLKVDNQSMIESVSYGFGGRVAMTKAYRAALEASVAKHFGGRLINCMANAMETYYCSPGSTLMRTSIDFWPKKPETHGQHLYCNAQVGVWFGEFMHPDWDMFQSAHAMGSFHAAGRAVSGGPVYVSDKPDAHNFDLLRKLVLSDGTVLRADNVGRPTLDCLFADVTRDPVLLKVFNYNRDCAVIGAFNANYHDEEGKRASISGGVSPADAPDLKGDAFIGFAHQAGRLWRSGRSDRAPLKLGEGEWEIVSFAPVDRGLAVLGLADKLNSTGAVTGKKWNADGSCTIALRDGGSFLAYAEKAPKRVEANGREMTFKHDASNGRLSVELPAGEKVSVTLHWEN